MANSIIRALQRTSKTILLFKQQPPMMIRHCCGSRSLTSEVPKDASELNLLKLLDYEIQYEYRTYPPSKPVPEFNSFRVDEKPTQQWITLTRKFNENEDIKIEATMFDKYIPPRIDLEPIPHVSMLVSICKGEGNSVLEFVCTVWPNRIKIRKVYTRNDNQADQPYMGPEFKDLDDELQKSLYKYLDERGIYKEFGIFLHNYMKNKDKSEFVRWMERVKSFIEMN